MIYVKEVKLLIRMKKRKKCEVIKKKIAATKLKNTVND